MTPILQSLLVGAECEKCEMWLSVDLIAEGIVRNKIPPPSGRGTLLKAVLETIGQKLNMKVLGEIQEGELIATKFNRLPLAEVFQSLSPDYGYQMGAEEGKQTNSRIFILPSPKGFVRPKPTGQTPQIIDPTASSELGVAEWPDESASGKKDNQPDKEQPPRRL